VNTEDVAGIEAAGISVQQLVAIISMQNEIARASMGFDRVTAVVAERAMALTEASGAVIELVDGDWMSYGAASGLLAPFLGLRVARATSLSGLCVREGVALYAADTATDPRVDRAACQRVGAASMICVPLLHGGQPVGALKVVSGRAHAFGAAVEAILRLLADVIAASMHHARAFDDMVAMSLQDSLTGLLNRRAFERQLVYETARAAAGDGASVALFDLDGLKAANDTFGHAEGDAILREAALLLRGGLRAGDTCFRLGGDEFAALLPGTNEDQARAIVHRLRAAVLAARLGRGTVGVSGGVAELRAGEAPEAAVARADAELYADKRHNRAARSFAAGSAGPPFAIELRPGL
jgi:diguanylate cyclase (GGDEF)-like protein